MTYAERIHRQMVADLRVLKANKSALGVLLNSVTITLNGKKYVVRTEQEADEILDAFA